MSNSQMPSPDNMQMRIDRVIDEAVGAEKIVGTVAIVARQGKVIYERAAGLSNREDDIPMEQDAIFRLSSLTKPIVSSAALAMMEAGKLALEDPVSKWIPEFAPRLADGSKPAITIHHLMTHTAGLSYGFLEADDGPYATAGVSDGLDQPGLSMAENLARIALLPLTYPPGASWGYSVATDVLGEVLSRADGRSLPDLVKEYIALPLGMHDTDFEVKDRDRLTIAYRDGDPRPVAMGDHQLVPFFGNSLSFAPGRILDAKSYPSGGSGMAGTARDILRLLEMIRTGGGNLLSGAWVKQLSRNQIGDRFVPMAGPGWGYGLTSIVLTDPVAAGTPQSEGTLSWGGVYGHNWFIDPVAGLTVIVLTNTAVAGLVGAFPDALRDAVYGAG